MNVPSTQPFRQALLSGAIVIAVDQLSKLAASVANGQQHGLVVPVHNPAFSLGVVSLSFAVEVTFMLVGIVGAAIYLLPRVRDARISGWIAGLVLGGAASNVIDRAVFGSVHDFLATPLVVFNVADIAVLLGVSGALYERIRVPQGR